MEQWELRTGVLYAIEAPWGEGTIKVPVKVLDATLTYGPVPGRPASQRAFESDGAWLPSAPEDHPVHPQDAHGVLVAVVGWNPVFGWALSPHFNQPIEDQVAAVSSVDPTFAVSATGDEHEERFQQAKKRDGFAASVVPIHPDRIIQSWEDHEAEVEADEVARVEEWTRRQAVYAAEDRQRELEARRARPLTQRLAEWWRS